MLLNKENCISAVLNLTASDLVYVSIILLTWGFIQMLNQLIVLVMKGISKRVPYLLFTWLQILVHLYKNPK